MQPQTDLAMTATYDPDLLRAAPWISLGFTPPEHAISAEGMLSWDERIMLSWLTERIYNGEGEIVELGVFLGSSTVSLASGLARNTRVTDKARRIHAYDLFAGEYGDRAIRAYNKTLAEGGGFRALYEANIAAYRDHVSVNEGDLTLQRWPGKPVEILFVDVMKSEPTVDAVVREFFPSLIPGRSLVVMQDYNDPVLPFSAIVMEHFKDYFAYAGETMKNSVLFVNTAKIPTGLLSGFTYAAMAPQLKLHHLTRALGKSPTFFGRECLAHQIKNLLQGGGA